MHFNYHKFKVGHRMGIYYCCDIYVGGIGDTLNYAQRPIPWKGPVPKPSNFIIHHHLNCYICPTKIIYKLIYKILKLKKQKHTYTCIIIRSPGTLTEYINTPSNYTKTVHININSISEANTQIIYFFMSNLVQSQNQRPFH